MAHTVSRWLFATSDDGDHVHVLPLDDTVDHDQDDDGDCVCRPRIEPERRDDGSIGWVFVHHSLDGREASETDIRGGG